FCHARRCQNAERAGAGAPHHRARAVRSGGGGPARGGGRAASGARADGAEAVSALWLLTAFFVLALLQSFLLSRFGLRALRYTRSFSRKAAFAGETVELVEVLRNEKPLPL